MIFGVLLNCAWQANLISYLTISKTSLPFTNLETLVTKSEFQIAIMPGSVYEDDFKLSLDPLFQRAWKERIQPYLKDYRPYQQNIIQILRNNTSIAVIVDNVAGR